MLHSICDIHPCHSTLPNRIYVMNWLDICRSSLIHHLLSLFIKLDWHHWAHRMNIPKNSTRYEISESFYVNSIIRIRILLVFMVYCWIWTLQRGWWATCIWRGLVIVSRWNASLNVRRSRDTGVRTTSNWLTALPHHWVSTNLLCFREHWKCSRQNYVSSVHDFVEIY